MKKVLHGIRKLSYWLSIKFAEIPSLLYGALYILLIFVFTGAYCLISNDFYHSTSKYEMSLKHQLSKITQKLQEVIADDFERGHGKSEVEFGNMGSSFVKKEDISIPDDSLRVDPNGMIDFMLCVTFHTNTRYGVHTMKNGVNINMSILPNSYQTREELRKGDGYVWRELRPDEEYVKFFLSATDASIPDKLFPRGRSGKNDNKIFIRMPNPMLGDIEAYQKAVAGFPAKSDGRINRMLYLSMVTITTLGYGDIVPLTPRARFLIGFEAVLGIIVIGLFLNSLFHESQQQKVQTPLPPSLNQT